jgi:rare lipoprotein A
MIISTRQFLSSVWLIIAALVATALFFALPAQAQEMNQAQTGYASWQTIGHHGAKMASGERYDHKAMTAGHSNLPFDSMVRVTNLETDESIVVRINDRMKSKNENIINLSGAAARQLGLFDSNATEIAITILEGGDITDLMEDASYAEDTVESTAEYTADYVSDAQASSNAPAEDWAQNSSKTTFSSVSDMPSVNLPVRVYEQPTIPAPSDISYTGADAPIAVGVYTLQIGSFSSLEGAEILAAQYQEAWISTVEAQETVSYRVYYNRFESELPARSAQNRLWAEGQDSFLRKVAP